jgi:metallo-beta-lactamase family protein
MESELSELQSHSERNSSPFRLRFLGAALTVTGSRYLLTNDKINILVDCGLFQGLKELRLKNWDRFPIEPSLINAIILTHAHLDHSGYIPRLVKEGFRGKVFCTKATLALCRILLADSGRIQEEEAEWLNRKKLSKHAPALPLYQEKDALAALELFEPQDFDEAFEVMPGVQATFKYAGHILGAASAIIEMGQIKIAFSGDLGRPNDPILFPPAKLPAVDFLIVESTYGNRRHELTNPLEDLEKVINEALEKKGVVLIPAFTVGRAQSLMYHLSLLKKEGRIENVPIYLNSPMATKVTDLYREFKSLHKLTEQQCDEMCNVVHYVKSVEESKELNKKSGPMIIISASGMVTGGRIIHHLKTFVSNPTTTVVLTGFQAIGTRGRALQEGAHEIKIHGAYLQVKARIRVLENISAHADYQEILNWLSDSGIKPQKVFITHGELEPANKMKEHIGHLFDWVCEVPRLDQEFILENYEKSKL